VQRNAACAYVHVLAFRERGHTAVDCALTCYALALPFGRMLAIGFGHDNVDRSSCTFSWTVTESGLVFQGGWLGNVAVASTTTELWSMTAWEFGIGLSCSSLLWLRYTSCSFVESKFLSLTWLESILPDFKGPAIIGIKFQAVSGGMQRNKVCTYGLFLTFLGRGDMSCLTCALTC